MSFTSSVVPTKVGTQTAATACAVGIERAGMVSALWMPLDSRLRGNDSVWRGEWCFAAHEPLCFNVTGY